MAPTPFYLADTSVWARAEKPRVHEALESKVHKGLVVLCGPVTAEMLRTARSPRHFAELLDELHDYRQLSEFNGMWDRVFSVQHELCRSSKHRKVPIPDLLIAAIAEHHAAIVLHYDTDFDDIATVTGQPTEWIVSRGTAD